MRIDKRPRRQDGKLYQQCVKCNIRRDKCKGFCIFQKLEDGERTADRMSGKRLTNRDYQILDYIKTYIAQYGYAPSYEEIGAGVNLHSKSSIYSHIQKLLQFGEIETDHPGSARAIRIKGAVVVMNTKDKDDKGSSREDIREAAAVEIDAHHREWLMGRFMGGTIS